MLDKKRPFKNIRVVRNLCKLTGETIDPVAVHWVKDLDFTTSDWEIKISYLEIMLPHLQEIATEPLSQLCLLQMIDSVHTQPDINWDTIGNMDRAVYKAYRDNFLLFSDLDDYLSHNFNILVQ